MTKELLPLFTRSFSILLVVYLLLDKLIMAMNSDELLSFIMTYEHGMGPDW